MAYSSFNFQTDDGIAIVSLNDPERLNALTFETYAELERVFLKSSCSRAPETDFAPAVAFMGSSQSCWT
jgi:enoyl-CoA hydratase/carnithine racemase